MNYTKKFINNEHNNLIHKKLFKDNYIVALMQELCIMGQCMIDGIVCSLFAGETGVAVQGMLYPYFSFIGIISALLLLGTQKLCVNSYCRGDMDRAEITFSTAIFFTAFISCAFAAICLGFTDSIVSFLGATGEYAELNKEAQLYLSGLCVSAPFVVLVPVIVPISQLNGQKKFIEISMVTILVADFLLTCLAGVLGLGMLGIGLATSTAKVAGFMVLFIPLLKESKLTFHLSSVKIKTFCEIAYFGMPKATRRICNVIRPILFNRFILALAGSMGMSVMSIRSGLSGTFESMGAALGSTVFVLTVLFVEEHNVSTLKRVQGWTMKFIMFPVSAICILIIIFAELLAKMYGQDNPESIEMAVTAIRLMAIDIVLFSLLESLLNYWQGIGETKVVNGMVIFIRLLFPVASLYVMGSLFGTIGIWASFPVASFISILLFFVPALIKYRKFTLFPVPKELSTQETSAYECLVDDSSSISDFSIEIQEFCLASGFDKRQSFYVALCFEEIAYGIMNYYESSGKKRKTIDFFLNIQEENAIIRVIDNCKEFDLVSFYGRQTFDSRHREKHLGIQIVMKASKDVRYRSMFGMNYLTIEV